MRSLRPLRSWRPLEIELRADLEEARLQHVGRTQPGRTRRCRERIEHSERPIAVEDVVDVEVEAGAIPVDLEPFGGTEIELVEVVVSVLRARLDQIHRLRGRAGRQHAAESAWLLDERV